MSSAKCQVSGDETFRVPVQREVTRVNFFLMAPGWGYQFSNCRGRVIYEEAGFVNLADAAAAAVEMKSDVERGVICL